VLQEVVVDRTSPGESVLHLVPVRELYLAMLPAEVDISAVEVCRKVDDPNLEVLEDTADSVELLDIVRDMIEKFVEFGVELVKQLLVGGVIIWGALCCLFECLNLELDLRETLVHIEKLRHDRTNKHEGAVCLFSSEKTDDGELR
jgi:hypothetical protein